MRHLLLRWSTLVHNDSKIDLLVNLIGGWVVHTNGGEGKYLLLRVCVIVCLLFFNISANAFPVYTTSSSAIIPPLSGKLIQGIDSKTLESTLVQQLMAQRQASEQWQHLSSPQKKARYEADILRKLLKNEGYYAAKVEVKIQQQDWHYAVDLGRPYTISQLKLISPIEIDSGVYQAYIKQGNVLTTRAVLAAQEALADNLNKHACLLDIKVDYQVNVYHQEASADVRFVVQESPEVNFGVIRIHGATRVESDYVQSFLPFQAGECFKRAKLNTARLRLLSLNLFSVVTVDVGEAQDGHVPVEIDLVERHHRTIRAGIGYQADEGGGVTLGWEQRSLWGRGENLRWSARVYEHAYRLGGTLSIPRFQKKKQSLRLFAEVEREETDAYIEKAGRVGAILSYPFLRYAKFHVGAELDFSRVDDSGEIEDYAMVSTPIGVDVDRRNDILDPSEGWMVALQLKPYFDAYASNTQFFKSSVAFSAYTTWESLAWRPTFALRTAVGSISGLSRENVPTTFRFYSGGGGSVRGYPFQSLGPFVDEEPDGGLAFSEVSIESRFRWKGNWGGVLFLDGGMAYSDRLAEANEELRWAAGIGIRYYSSFAPIRFDIARPLSLRDGIDDPVQFYINLGQAF